MANTWIPQPVGPSAAPDAFMALAALAAPSAPAAPLDPFQYGAVDDAVRHAVVAR